MKDNKLIAEFMGDALPLNTGMMGLSEADVQDLENLKYDTSWDWLMPVLDKVKKIRCLPDEHDESFSWVCKSSDIEAEYNAVVEFIKTYNQNK